jgi:hypothetical protein
MAPARSGLGRCAATTVHPALASRYVFRARGGRARGRNPRGSRFDAGGRHVARADVRHPGWRRGRTWAVGAAGKAHCVLSAEIVGSSPTRPTYRTGTGCGPTSSSWVSRPPGRRSATGSTRTSSSTLVLGSSMAERHSSKVDARVRFSLPALAPGEGRRTPRAGRSGCAARPDGGPGPQPGQRGRSPPRSTGATLEGSANGRPPGLGPGRVGSSPTPSATGRGQRPRSPPGTPGRRTRGIQQTPTGAARVAAVDGRPASANPDARQTPQALVAQLAEAPGSKPGG